MTLQEFTRGVDGFKDKGPTDKVRLICWYLHTHRGMDRIAVPHIGQCFDELHLSRPNNLNQLVAQMVDKTILKDAKGLRLAGDMRDQFAKLYGNRAETVAVDDLLSGLPAKLSDPGQQEYLDEALVCFRNKAFRAATIMTWNVTYDHLVTVVVAKRLSDFNKQIAGMFGGKKGPMTTKDDFQDLKESETIEVCRAAGLISREVAKVLKDKLDRRNSAAHPSGSKVDKLQAEEYISNLINNAMLKIS